MVKLAPQRRSGVGGIPVLILPLMKILITDIVCDLFGGANEYVVIMQSAAYHLMLLGGVLVPMPDQTASVRRREVAGAGLHGRGEEAFIISNDDVM